MLLPESYNWFREQAVSLFHCLRVLDVFQVRKRQGLQTSTEVKLNRVMDLYICFKGV